MVLIEDCMYMYYGLDLRWLRNVMSSFNTTCLSFLSCAP